jgi:hypothetical protein
MPNSSLSRRLEVVRGELRRALGGLVRDMERRPQLISMCAGDGRDVLPVLADTENGSTVRALLVELDERLAVRARRTAERLHLHDVEVRTADAGVVESYVGYVPADVVMACGVFGNISRSHIERTITALPRLLADDGIVIWTRGRGDGDIDPSVSVRETFAAHGFDELSFTAPRDAKFRVGAHQLRAAPTAEPSDRSGPSARMFTFAE